jgi:hypothetical protein
MCSFNELRLWRLFGGVSRENADFSLSPLGLEGELPKGNFNYL